MENFYKLYTEHFKTAPYNVLEIGSRDGIDADKLRKLAGIPPDRTYVVEPHPESAKRIRSLFPNFHVYEVAIYDKIGVLPFNAVPYTHTMGTIGTSSLLKVSDRIAKSYPPPNWIKVMAITGQMLLELINMPNIDLIKIDVEGATHNVLTSFGDDIRLMKAMHLEMETEMLWQTDHTISETQKLLTFYGFKEVWNQTPYPMQQDSVWIRMGNK